MTAAPESLQGLAPASPGVIAGLHEMAASRNPLRDARDRRIPRVAGPCVLVMFGVTGDLARKKLMPAVYDLANRGLLPPGFSFVGFARRGWAHEDFAHLADCNGLVAIVCQHDIESLEVGFSARALATRLALRRRGDDTGFRRAVDLDNPAIEAPLELLVLLREIEPSCGLVRIDGG